ncbi:MAG: hypothetical protein H6780_02670 [Candidatus Nomurabacteria bacterium]|nr:MAG: hypothetical protein H6780_02670 [Candidatus Nomurabacteria bacterium]
MSVYIGDIGGPMERIDHEETSQDYTDSVESVPEIPSENLQEVPQERPASLPVDTLVDPDYVPEPPAKQPTIH